MLAKSRYLLATLAVAACTQNDPATSLYHEVEAGSTWQLTITQLDAGYPPGPKFAMKTATVPAGTTTPCDSGCSCGALTFSVEDEGEPFSTRNVVSARYTQTCSDGFVLGCSGGDLVEGSNMACSWNQNGGDSLGEYTAELVRAR
jgi:hypothetical protein